MNAFDVAITSFLNQFAHDSYLFDRLMDYISGNSLVKGGFVGAVFWWMWFRNNKLDCHNKLIISLISGLSAVVFTRFFAKLFPLRFRPIFDETLDFNLVAGYKLPGFDGLSSFPSDHAALFFGIAVSFMFLSRRIGIILLLHSLVIISFPRIYLGIHYTTDILAGALIGAVFAFLGNVFLIRMKFFKTILSYFYSKPYLLYSLLFVFTYQMAVLFVDLRMIINLSGKFMKWVLV